MNNEEAIVVEHSTTDRIESLYDDIRSVEKRLGTVFSILCPTEALRTLDIL